MKRLLLILLALVVAAGFVFASGQKAEETEGEGEKPQLEIAMVVKLEGVAWFDNMRLGIQEFNREHPDARVWQTGADTADPAAQVNIVDDLIAQGVDAILVVPNDPASLVPSFKRARAAGIKTVTHEAANIQNADYDVEAFVNKQYGAHMASIMAEWMGGEGVWQPFVGHLTSTTHNQWVDGEVEYLQENHPDAEMATDRLEEKENQQVAYEKSLELLKSYPELEAIMGSAMSTVPGAAQAIEEQGRVGDVAAFGTCLPSVAGEYIESGAAKSIHFWVPAHAGYVAANVAYHMLKDQPIEEGMDLGKPGYENVQIDENEDGVPVVRGEAWVDVNQENLDEWKNEEGEYEL